MELINSIAQLAPVTEGILLSNSEIIEDNNPIASTENFISEEVFQNEQLYSDAKRLFAAANKIAQVKNFEGFETLSPVTTALTADTVFMKFRLAYQLANGEISIDDAAEFIADKAVSVIKTIAERVINEDNIKLGLDKAIDVIATKFPQVTVMKKYTERISHFISKPIRIAVNNGLPKLRNTIKNVVASVFHKVASVANKVKDKLKEWQTIPTTIPMI